MKVYITANYMKDDGRFVSCSGTKYIDRAKESLRYDSKLAFTAPKIWVVDLPETFEVPKEPPVEIVELQIVETLNAQEER